MDENVVVENNEEVVLTKETVKPLDENTDVEFTKGNNYDPSGVNLGSNFNLQKPYVRVRKPFDKYGSFSAINSSRGGFARMAGLGFVIALGMFLLLYLFLRQ